MKLKNKKRHGAWLKVKREVKGKWSDLSETTEMVMINQMIILYSRAEVFFFPFILR